MREPLAKIRLFSQGMASKKSRSGVRLRRMPERGRGLVCPRPARRLSAVRKEKTKFQAGQKKMLDFLTERG